jgi:2-hydroxychromene-2-carboxylate isomerase
VPTIIVDGELYWGQERFEQIFANHARIELEVFWDFSSPFAYLGATQVEALA